MLNYQTVVAIVLMALTIHATCATAYLILRNRVLTPGAMVALKFSPGCVTLALIVPFFASGAPADLIVLGIALFIAMRLSMPITVVNGVLAAFILRHYFG